MIIQDFKPEDRETFLTLCENFYSSHSTLKPFCRESAINTFEHVIAKHENLWGYLLIDSEGSKPVGYALVTSYWCNEEGGNVIVLDELYISPDNRHHGYGSRFLEWLGTHFHDFATSITLEVLTTNQDAKSLYQKEGMQPDGFTTYTKSI